MNRRTHPPLTALINQSVVSAWVNEPGIPNDGKVDLLGGVSILEDMINVTIKHPTDPGVREMTE